MVTLILKRDYFLIILYNDLIIISEITIFYDDASPNNEIISKHPSVSDVSTTDPCGTSQCGANSQCRVVNQVAVCSCLPTYIGSPPTCRPECVTSSECATDKACVQQKCVNPCPSSCGQNSDCRVINHAPLCSCLRGYTGDPFTVCFSIPCEYLEQ